MTDVSQYMLGLSEEWQVCTRRHITNIALVFLKVHWCELKYIFDLLDLKAILLQYNCHMIKWLYLKCII
jgi:hypothetical protein